MPFLHRPALLDLLRHVAQWLLLACGVAVLAGSASAFFLFALDWATDTSDDIACLRARLSPARCAALQAWWLTPEVQQLLGPFPRA